MSDFDCTLRGGEFAGSVCIDSWCEPEPTWGCLDAPVTLNGENGPFPITFHIQDIRLQEPLAGVQARLCRKGDLDCNDPQGGVVTSDDRGVVRFAVEATDPALGFTGFVLFTRADLVPGLYFWNRALVGAVDVPPLQMLSHGDVDALARQLGTTRDSSRGIVLLRTFDCQDDPAAGVAVVTDGTDEQSAPFYANDGLPVATSTTTDRSGYAGFMNVPPGTINITGRVDSDRRLLSTISLRVQPDAITYSPMVPRGR
jgi:hypothetical protein